MSTQIESGDSSPVYTVARGHRGAVQILGKKINATRPYGGTFVTNAFKVTREILLTEISFFGPPEIEVEPQHYYISVDIFKSTKNSPKTSVRLAKIRSYVQVETELFWITLPNPILIEPRVWYSIQFCLDDGPNTLCCATTETHVKMRIGGKSIHFNFLIGSMQMPYMRFKLTNDSDHEAIQETTKAKERWNFLKHYYMPRETIQFNRL